MAKYKIYARRNPYTDWSAWCDTDDEKVAENAKQVIESYEYQWTDEELMSRNDFKARCFGRGIKLGKINKFVEGRYRFSSADITTLEEM
jgi:hypothetical protein